MNNKKPTTEVVHLLKCLNCGKILEVSDEEIADGQVDCFICGYSNELKDDRVVVYDEIRGKVL